ncbi:MAG: hypothetical protein ACM3L9_03380, partial [Deltaproteobacteria bacterium]
GCGDGGFRPMYGGAAVGGAGASEKLAQVDISTIPGRVGQQIRNEFIYQASGGGARPEPVYRLEIAIRESLTSTLIDKTGDARAQIYNLDASFKLIRIADSQVVLEGVSYSRAAFDRFNSIYSNVRAREEAETRAAKTVAEDLRTRISAFVSTAA